MRTREDVQREVTRMLDDDRIRKPRVLQFFRDYFDYDLAVTSARTPAPSPRPASRTGTDHYSAMFDATASTDRLIEMILEEDKDVLKELLTTERVVATRRTRPTSAENTRKKSRPLAVAAKKQTQKEQEEQRKPPKLASCKASSPARKPK
jgi:hypothetical protein